MNRFRRFAATALSAAFLLAACSTKDDAGSTSGSPPSPAPQPPGSSSPAGSPSAAPEAAGQPSDDAGAQPAIPPGKKGELSKKLVGRWAFPSGGQAVEQMKADARKVAGSDEKRYAELVKEGEENIKGMTLEYTASAMLTRQNATVINEQKYEVVREDEKTIVLKMLEVGHMMTVVLEDDDTLLMGTIKMKRKK